MVGWYYSDTIEGFLQTPSNEILGVLSDNNEFPLEGTQKNAWVREISILKEILIKQYGRIYFEYSIPRMGKRIDVILIIKSVIFVLEFKVGASEFNVYDIDQVWDYALDLKYFHETSHNNFIVPILISTDAESFDNNISFVASNDKVAVPIKSNKNQLVSIIDSALIFFTGEPIEAIVWEKGRYQPTPSIIEAAIHLYNHHTVENIHRSDSGKVNLLTTSNKISEIIEFSKFNNRKTICFVTGVPGSGKTLVGLHTANKHTDIKSELYSVFLSGNGPLVAILREALTRNKVDLEKKLGKKIKKGVAMRSVKQFIQNVHNFRDASIIDMNNPPIEHVALFDEAQRAWNVEQTSKFMKTKKKIEGFNISEPEFLISCMDRHKDWSVIVCLVGGGQEINVGEAGISEWILSIKRSFPNWDIYISPKLEDSEYLSNTNLIDEIDKSKIYFDEKLHLSVSMRSIRSENVSLFVKQLLDIDIVQARDTYSKFKQQFPIVVTRSIENAKNWLTSHARGNERYGLIVSSQAERLKPQSIFVKSPVDPIHWFLEGKDDVRSSYSLEDVVTEFDIQGLELDWSCVIWDADFRFNNKYWENWSFLGNRWTHIIKEERKIYQKNAYRVLLTRARMGMVIVVPEGNILDQSRRTEFYDNTYKYLVSLGIPTL